jgi:S-(hydroxymethyl)mycothiol dehydrogenase
MQPVAGISATGVVARQAGAPSRLEEISVDDPGPGEVRLRLLASGVCHTDLYARDGGMGDAFPWLLGHEGCGVIESVGPGVDPARAGDRVIICWRAPCGRCRYCLRGSLELCADVASAGPRMHGGDGAALSPVLRAGTFATHTVVAASQAIPVGGDVPAEVAALIGCGVATGVGAALRTAGVQPGDRVAIIGCGAVGLSAVQGARLAGAATIIAVDLSSTKLDWARRMGATAVVDATSENVVERVRQLAGGYGVDYCLDVVARPETIQNALECCDNFGTAVLVGVPPPQAELTLAVSMLWNERRGIKTCWYGNCLGSRDFQLLADWYRNGSLHLDEMVSRRIRLDEVEAAFAVMAKGEELRSVIVFD